MCKVLYMTTGYAAITDPDKLLKVIEDLADEQLERAGLIRELTIHAVRDLGVQKIAAAAAADISRPTLDAWLGTDKEKS